MCWSLFLIKLYTYFEKNLRTAVSAYTSFKIVYEEVLKWM